MDGLAFTEGFIDQGDQLIWTLTLNTPAESGATNQEIDESNECDVDGDDVSDVHVDVDLCKGGRSLMLDLASANLVSGTYDLKVETKDEESNVVPLNAQITLEQHPLQGNNDKEGGFGGYIEQSSIWFFRWSEVHWNDMSWSDGVRSGGWVTLKRDGVIISEQNVSGVHAYNGHSSAVHELCLVGTDICSGPLPVE